MSLLLAVVIAAQISAPPSGEFLLKTGDLAPPFSMRTLDNKTFAPADVVGTQAKEPKKAAMLVFFATWCEPCKKEIPIIKDVYQRWQKKGVTIAYIGFSQSAKDLGQFCKDQKMPWPVVPDSFGLLSRRYGAAQLPHLVVIGPDGRIAFQHGGLATDLKSLLDTELARITGEPVPGGGNATPATAEAPRFSRTLRLARLPASEGSAARWQGLASYLGEAAAANIEIASPATYDAFAEALQRGEVDVANAGPLMCEAVHDLYEPVARIERQGESSYHSILFVKRDSPVMSVAQLKGKRLGLVSARSTSGGLFLKVMLLEAGLDPQKDVNIVWLGSHEKVAQAVKEGKVDAGGCYDDCRDAAWPDEAAKGAATRVVAYSAPIPGELIIIKRALDASVKASLKKALAAAGAENGILAQMSQGELAVTGIVPATEADLDAIRKVVARLSGAAK